VSSLLFGLQVVENAGLSEATGEGVLIHPLAVGTL
jgi:hypothetical protein